MKRSLVCAVTVALFLAGPARGQVQTFRNDYPGFVNAAGPIHTIDFETLPDGTPSAGHVGTPITASFNYDLQGAHFTAGVGDPVIGGNTTSGFGLISFTGVNGPHTWIAAELVSPSHAVGITFGGDSGLCAYDAAGAQLGCVSYGSAGEPFFVGIVSQVPIARVVADRGTFLASMDSFVFSPVPEPATAGLVGAGALWALRRRRGLRTCRC